MRWCRASETYLRRPPILRGLRFWIGAAPSLLSFRVCASRPVPAQILNGTSTTTPRPAKSTPAPALVNYHYGPFTVGGGDAFLRVIDTAPRQDSDQRTDFHQFRVLAGYGQLNKRGFSAAASFGFDANGNLQYATAQTSYNWDCCGMSLEYRRFALGAVRNENEYRFLIYARECWSFGNLKRQERLY